MHYWGDEDFDWAALNKAEKIIRFWAKIGRIGMHTKEKYGTLRASTYFWDGSLHSLIYPGYVYSQFPDWLWKLDFKLRRFIPSVLIKGVQYLQIPFYTLGYYRAMKKFPHIKTEICVDADCPDLIIGGRKIYDKHWVKVE